MSRAFERCLAFRWEARRGPGAGADRASRSASSSTTWSASSARSRAWCANTEQFLAGLPSNHVLLFGERGTGKSSAVKGLLARFAARGLRVVEVHKEDLLHLPDVLEALRGAP